MCDFNVLTASTAIRRCFLCVRAVIGLYSGHYNTSCVCVSELVFIVINVTVHNFSQSLEINITVHIMECTVQNESEE